MRRPLTRALLAALLGAAAISSWVLLAPRQLPGGSASYVVPAGSSMLPLLDRDDLVVTREAAGYRVGDVIAYESASLDRTVLHRIVRTEDGRYVTKGDNNDWLDRDRPTDADVHGRMVLRVPRGGTVLAWIRVPRNAAVAGSAAAVLVTGGVGLGVRRRRRRGQEQPPRPARVARPSRALRATAVSLGLATLGLGALALVAHERPVTRLVPTRVPYEHAGQFGYVALAEPGAVYPDGQVDSGEPVFLKVSDRVGVRFMYTFSSDHPRTVRGSVGMTAELEDGTGWSRSFSLQEATPFDGDEAVAMGTLDLPRIGGLIRQVEKATEIPRPAYTLTLRPSVEIEATLATRPVHDSFAPELVFDANPLLLRLAEPEEPDADPTDALTASGRGSVVVREDMPNPIGLGPVTLDTQTVRRVAPVALGVVGVLFLIVGLLAVRRGRTEPARILGRYGHRIVPVAAGGASLDGPVVDVATMAALARVADSYDRMILHEDRDPEGTFLVEGDVAVYRYRTDGVVPIEEGVVPEEIAASAGSFLDEPPEPDTRFLDELEEPASTFSAEERDPKEEPEEESAETSEEQDELPAELPAETSDQRPAEDVAPQSPPAPAPFEAEPAPFEPSEAHLAPTSTGLAPSAVNGVPAWPALPPDDETRWSPPQPAPAPAWDPPADVAAEPAPFEPEEEGPEYWWMEDEVEPEEDQTEEPARDKAGDFFLSS